MDKVQFYTFLPSQDIKQNVLLSSYTDKRCRQTLRYIFNHPLKQWPSGRKRGEDGNTKILLSRERKELF